MGGGLMQLVAYGAQDIYLTGNPQITFFKVVYRRHTNFSMEAISQTFNGTSSYGGSVNATISRNGDLVGRMYLEHEASLKSAHSAGAASIYVGCDYGSHLIKEAELEIGGQRIDKQYGHWHSVYGKLTESNPTGSNDTLYNRMTGNGVGIAAPGSTGTAGAGGCWDVTTGGSAVDTWKGRFFIPLQFWFCRNPGLALPLIALQYHEVKVKMVFENLNNLVLEDSTNATFADKDDLVDTGHEASETSFTLWVDYIYLDTDERRRFAQVPHEYLIEQVQHEEFSATTTMTLNFNHPVKELIWTGIRNDAATAKAVDRTGTTVDSLYALSTLGSTDYQLKLNGHDRFAGRDVTYFTRTQVWQHHTGYGATGTKDRIGVYSFALKPEEHQPSGTCNFSRIDNAQLTGGSAARHVYAVNYNVLRIMSGMGGLAYSN